MLILELVNVVVMVIGELETRLPSIILLLIFKVRLIVIGDLMHTTAVVISKSNIKRNSNRKSNSKAPATPQQYLIVLPLIIVVVIVDFLQQGCCHY